MKKIILLFVIVFLLMGIIYFEKNRAAPTPVSLPSSSPRGSPIPSPPPRPLTFAEMQQLYGPCVHLPVLMYHHVEEKEKALSGGFKALNVEPSIFRSQLEYLKNKGYKTLSPSDLVAFFDSGQGISPKSVILTFDDGYSDFASQAFPILAEYGNKATLFLPTGLMGNPMYLTWDSVNWVAASGLVYVANHTWSHKNVAKSPEVAQKEISLAAKQLSERGLDNLKIFAYPYGVESSFAKNYLQSQDFSLAFTTKPGSTLCKKQRFSLPRIRIGNTSLSSYGL